MAHSVLDGSLLGFECLHVFKGSKNLQVRHCKQAPRKQIFQKGPLTVLLSLLLFSFYHNNYLAFYNSIRSPMPHQSGTLPNLAGAIVDGGRLELVNTIGAGAYGRLYKARDVVSSSSSSSSSSSTFYAVKCLKRPALSSRDAMFQDRERMLHRRVSCHPNVVTLHRYFVDPDHVYLVMDLCTGGDMYGAILDGVYHGQTELIKRTFASLVDAVRFCHSRGVYHRDLKPENVLVDHEGGNPLIADFGLSTESKLSRDVDCGSGSYMCPGMSHPLSSSSSQPLITLHRIFRRGLLVVLPPAQRRLGPLHHPRQPRHRHEPVVHRPALRRALARIHR